MNTKDYLNTEDVKQEIMKRIGYNESSGLLFWRERPGKTYFNNNYLGKVVGKPLTDKFGYTAVIVKFEVFGRLLNLVASRICWLCKTGSWPRHTIDHINGDSTDNRFLNLRDIPQGKNNINKRVYKCNKTGYKGVCLSGNRFSSRLSFNNRTYFLGRFNTPEEAALAYNKKATEVWGPYAVLNALK